MLAMKNMGKEKLIGLWRHTTPAFDPRPGLKRVALILLLVLSLLVVSCGRRDEDAVFLLGTEGVTLQGAATLICSDPCRDSGQCGTIDATWVVLASSSGPATTLHDLTFPVDVNATILANQMQIVQSVSDPSQESRLVFYAVDVPEFGQGWVAGWCIGQEIVP